MILQNQLDLHLHWKGEMENLLYFLNLCIFLAGHLMPVTTPWRDCVGALFSALSAAS